MQMAHFWLMKFGVVFIVIRVDLPKHPTEESPGTHRITLTFSYVNNIFYVIVAKTHICKCRGLQ